VPAASPIWNQRIAFRDALRQSSALTNEYQQLKVRLAAAYGQDREAYTEGKAPFIQKVLQSIAESAA
jgi:GrpB-like predicted nucleotidyltransferase (UPF0157 family)